MVGTLMFVAFMWFIFGRRRRPRGGLGRWRNHVQHHVDNADVGGWIDTYRGGARVAQKRQGDVLSARVQGALPPESPLDALKRRYVADEITVEEYEAQLDELLRKK